MRPRVSSRPKSEDFTSRSYCVSFSNRSCISICSASTRSWSGNCVTASGAAAGSTSSMVTFGTQIDMPAETATGVPALSGWSSTRVGLRP